MSATADSINSNTDRVSVAIVGGGMVGLSLALMLSKVSALGRVALFEKRANGFTQGDEFDRRSTALASGSVGILDRMGLWPQLSEYACAIQKVKVSDRGHLGSVECRAEQEQALGYVVDNGSLIRVLLDHVQGSDKLEYYTGTDVSDLSCLSDGMRFSVRRDNQSSVMEADLVVLADGALSRQAAKLGIAYENHNYGQHALIANVQHSKDHEGCAYERFTEQGPMALLPLNMLDGKHRSALVWTHADSHIEDALAKSDQAFLSELQSRLGYRVGRFQKVGQRVAYPLNLQFAKEQVRSSLVLMGNAAHYLHPVAGQGLNLTLRDCVALVKSLELGIKQTQPLGSLSVLQRYLNNRELDQKLTAGLSHSFIELFGSDHRFKQVSRTAGLLAMNKTPKLKSLFFQQMMGQGVFGGAGS